MDAKSCGQDKFHEHYLHRLEVSPVDCSLVVKAEK